MSGGLTTHQITSVEISTDSGTSWYAIPGVSSISKSGGDGSTTEVEAIDGKSQTVTGPGPATYNVTLATLVANHPAIEACIDAADNNTLLSVRFVTKAETILAAASSATVRGVKVTSGGVATVEGSDLPDFTTATYNPGLVMTISTNDYTIESITSATVVQLDPSPSAAINTAATYSIKRPAIIETTTARLQNAGGWESGVGAPISGTLIFAPENRAFFEAQ